MKIENVFIENELTDSYLNYAISVIIGRALPDVRDGLKPVHRRTLFAMKELDNNFNKPYKKSARIVGDVIGKYHPHGEMAVYDSIVRLSQSFVLRYPLIDGQGNFGSIDGDPAAAMRYTEIRMSELSSFFLYDLEYKPVDYINNYDNTEKYPSILPTMIPNLLINGSHGIAVGVATNIPPHNISEIINACLAIINNKKIDIEELMSYITGPDFPTSGNINGIKEIYNSYKNGKGKINVSSKIKIEEIDGKKFIIINELPYQINKAKLIEKIFILIKNEKLKNIKSVKDESDKDGLRISLETINSKKQRMIFKKIKNQTQINSNFNINMIALVNNKPKLLNLKDLFEHFINYRIEVIYRKIQFIFKKFKEKKYTSEGLLLILLNINLFISFLNNSIKIEDLKNKLKKQTWIINKFSFFFNNIFDRELINKFKRYKLSKKQIQKASDLKIGNLVKIQKDKIYKDYILNEENILINESILKNEISIINIMKKEMNFIKNKFDDKKKTKILIDPKNSIIENDKINNEKIIILFKRNNIKIKKFDKENDKESSLENNIEKIFINNAYNFLFYFSNLGKIYYISLLNILISSKTLKGINLKNFFDLNKNEFSIIILFIKTFKKEKFVLIITKKAGIKKFSLNELKEKIIKKKITINLFKKDELIKAKITQNYEKLAIISNLGKIIKINLNKIKQTKKESKYLKIIKFKNKELALSIIKYKNLENIITITKFGDIKKNKLKKKIINIKIFKEINIIKKNNIIKAEMLNNLNNLLLITSDGKILKIETEEIKYSSRFSKNSFFLKTEKNESFIYFKKLNKGD